MDPIGACAAFTADPAVAQLAAPLLPLVAAAQPLNGFVFAADGVLQVPSVVLMLFFFSKF